jgi:hypothetical protein
MPTLTCPHCGTAQTVDPQARAGPPRCVRCGQSLANAAFAPGAPRPSVEPVEPLPVGGWEEPVPVSAPPFPGIVRAAGIIWIVFGGLILLNFILVMALVLVFAPPEARGAAVGVAMCVGVFVGLIGGVFIFVGVQTVTGSARDTLGNGIGSIIFSVLVSGSGVSVLQRGGASTGDLIAAGINLLAAGGLMAAGIMVLIGRDQYRTWKRSLGGGPPRRR